MNRLKQLRQEKNLTIRELGEETKISYSTISAMENEVRPFTQSNLEILCKYFDVSSDYLLGNTDIRKNPARNTSVDPNDVSFALHSTIDKLSEADKKFILQMAQRMLDPNDSHN